MQLPAFDIITEAFADVWNNRRDFAAFAFLPVMVMSIAGIVITALIGDLPANVEDPSQVPPEIAGRLFVGAAIYVLISFIMYTLFAVAWHRRTLVGPEATTIGTAMRWGQRQWRFFRRLVLIFINLTVLSLFLALLLRNFVLIGPILGAFLIAMSLIYARIALILPAAATDTPMTWAESVRLTKGNSWRMMFAVVILPLIVMLIGGLALFLIVALLASLIGGSVTGGFVVSLLRHAINYFSLAVGITALSLAYKQLTA